MSFRKTLAIEVGRAVNDLFGAGSDHVLPRMEQMQWWDAERLSAWRLDRLRELVEHSADHVPWYRERLSVRDLLDPCLSEREILEQIPVLTKDDLRAGAGRMIALDRARRMRASTTSGSSGRPVTVQLGDEAVAWARASQRRAFRWFGVEVMEPRMLLLAAPLGGRLRIRHKVADLVLWRRLFEFASLDPERLREVARAIVRYRPSYVTAYPSVLHALCWACLDGNIDLKDSGVRLVHAQSEMLESIHLAAIKRVFGEQIPVLNEYGCVEVGGMAHTCPQGGLHPAHDHVIVEVVDSGGEPTSPGQIGRVLLTPLHARAMPLLRYDVGDAAVLGHESCPCGRMNGMRSIARLEGRAFEKIQDRRGKSYSGGIVHFIVKKAGATHELREYLAVQRAAGCLEFQAVPDGVPRADLEERLRRSASEVFGDGLEVTCQIRDAVERPKGRKRAYFVSEIEATP